jgi:hypothetical protein
MSLNFVTSSSINTVIFFIDATLLLPQPNDVAGLWASVMLIMQDMAV